MTGGPKRGQPWPPNISSPVKPFRDEASKFGALRGHKRKFRSGHEFKKKKKKKKERGKTMKIHAKTHTHSSLGLTGPNFAFGMSFW